MAKNELLFDMSALKELMSRVDKAAERFPELRAEMFAKVAKVLPEFVDRNIRSISPEIHGETVQGWQDGGRVGSRGGYAAIAPKRKTFKQQGGRQYAVGYLTNTLTHGTVNVRHPSGNNPRYKPRIKYGQIRRRPFYTNAARDLDREKAQLAGQFAQELAQILKGQGE